VAQGRSVVRGVFAVLDVLNGADGLGPTELAARAGLPKATVHRLLEQLIDEDAVERYEGRYRLGPAMFRLGHWRPAQRLRAAARLPMRELAAAARGASVSLALLWRGGTIVAGTLPGEADHLMPLTVGNQCGPGSEPSLLWAAHRPDTAPPDGFPLAEWRRRVRAVRASGVVRVASSMKVPELAALGVPVRDAGGAVVASLGCLVLDHRRLSALEPLVCRAARLTSGNIARNYGV
jgi:IclR family transcriptional regulator, acetate operon repressor